MIQEDEAKYGPWNSVTGRNKRPPISRILTKGKNLIRPTNKR
jgi:hypothetical protein